MGKIKPFAEPPPLPPGVQEITKLLRLELLTPEQWDALAATGGINRDALYLTPRREPHIFALDSYSFTAEDIAAVPHNSLVFMFASDAPAPPPEPPDPGEGEEPDENEDNGNA